MLLLGLDLGTSATKALLLDPRAGVLASASAEHPLHQPNPGWSEQHPADWWRSAVAATRQVCSQAGSIARDSIAAIGLSGQMHGSVLIPRAGLADCAAGAVLRPAILWNDQRTSAECSQIETAVGSRRRLVELCGNAALPGFTLPKLLWVRAHEPRLWDQVGKILLPKDYLAWRLTGQFATDVGDASGTLLFDIDARRWSDPLRAQFQIDAALVPPALESTSVTGRLTPAAARELHLPAGIPVIIGSGDNMAGAVGAGVVQPGQTLASLGTSGVIYIHSGQPSRDLLDPHAPGRLHTMCAATGPRGWCSTGCTLSAGGALKWARDTIAPGEPYDMLMAEAATAPPGCEGLAFLPFLTGERCPHPDPLARAGWIGLTSRHTRAHLLRAVIEGVTFTMGRIIDLARAMGASIDAVRVTGGGNRSALWRQMQADVYGAPVELLGEDEGGCAKGAAILAGVGIGAWPSVAAACAEAVGVKVTIDPHPAADYARPRELHARLYADLRQRFADIASTP